MSDDIIEIRGDYLTQLRHVDSLAKELEVERDKLTRLADALHAAENRRQSPLQNVIGALGHTSTAKP